MKKKAKSKVSVGATLKKKLKAQPLLKKEPLSKEDFIKIVNPMFTIIDSSQHDGQFELKTNDTLKPSLDDEINVQMLDVPAPVVGLPHPPKKTPTGTYYQTEKGDFVYAPVLPSSGRAKVSSAPEPRKACCKENKTEETISAQSLNKNEHIDKAIDALKSVAQHSLDSLNTTEMIKIADFIVELRSWQTSQ